MQYTRNSIIELKSKRISMTSLEFVLYSCLQWQLFSIRVQDIVLDNNVHFLKVKLYYTSNDQHMPAIKQSYGSNLIVIE